MNYYKEKQYIAAVDKNDQITGKVERWEAHEKGILHRGFTCILIYDNQLILQHRKHPAFDGYFDLSFSSHQIYKAETLQTDQEAILDSLKREWNLTKKDLIKELKFLGKIYYKAKDSGSIYTEHEIDYIYKVDIANLPNPNYEFCYGFYWVNKEKLTNSKFPPTKIFAPWMETMISKISL